MIILWAVLILGLLGLIFGIILQIASKKFYVKKDTKVEDITNMLPNYNCGGCGCLGCKDFAQKICEGKVTKLSLCKPGKKENFDKIIEYTKNIDNIHVEI